MGRSKQGKKTLDARLSASYNKLKKDPGVPKLIALKKKERNHEPGHTKGDVTMGPPPPRAATISSLAISSNSMAESILESGEPESSRGQRDSTVTAHAHQFRKVLELSDVIIQVLDARDPLGCRSRIVEDEVRKAGRRASTLSYRFLVFELTVQRTINEDLVPKENVLAWLRYLRHDCPTVPLKSSSSQLSTQSSSKNKGGAPHLLTLLKSYRRAHTSLTVGIVGPPNVGKSSLINSLSRLRGGGGDVVRVGAKPGETRDIKQVGIEKGLKVLDMPGIVWGDFLGDGSSVGSGAPRIGSLNMMGVEFLEDPVGAVEGIISRVPPETLQRIYSVPPFATAAEFLVMVALSRGRLGKGGAPDQVTAARSVLNDWNAGSIPYHTVPPTIHPSSIPSNPAANMDINDGSKLTTAADVGAAQIVSKFSEPFDLAGLFSLTDKLSSIMMKGKMKQEMSPLWKELTPTWVWMQP
ncbi:hypothetical protein BS47DRAFT_1436447 [Hydnum rufescens UP504]|uniref:G domain-containing protein n=1 Tax=Hydnum rufescens UP504 TaxID=1448309 RepID=A0A9P6AGZ3_9AGAM|nr:hypothetical protein BS47DRAFT_1436447 [Hydnum rufescens UP504]